MSTPTSTSFARVKVNAAKGGRSGGQRQRFIGTSSYISPHFEKMPLMFKGTVVVASTLTTLFNQSMRYLEEAKKGEGDCGNK